LLLLDEPTAHLDPVSAAEVAEVIGTLAAGRTVLVVTHRDTSLFTSVLSGSLVGTAGVRHVPAVRVLHMAEGSVAESPAPDFAVPA
jgi:energy-coupling factor transporter ATP-binding protein EcfA2